MVGTVGIEPTMLPYRNRFTVYRDTTSSHLIPRNGAVGRIRTDTLRLKRTLLYH